MNLQMGVYQYAEIVKQVEFGYVKRYGVDSAGAEFQLKHE